MEANKVLEIVLREMCAYGNGWRANWSEFDGRELRDQLDDIAEFSKKALASEENIDYVDGTDFCNKQYEY